MLDILVVDDEPGIRSGVAYALCDAGHHVTEAADGAEALQLIAGRVFDVVFCDVRLPKIDGLTVFQRAHREAPRTAFILMTGFARVAEAKAALRAGAYDYITKPFDGDFPLDVVARIEAERALARARQEVVGQLRGGPRASPIIGRSPPMVRLLDRLDTLSASDAPVLLTGESGTGKELIARALHQRSRRRQRAFVAVNCAALPETLLEAELFGHERGAFTGAVKQRDGRFKLADGGTLLLDEIGEIPLAAQAKLLRVLQEGTIEPVGSNVPIAVDVRIVSATHQNLKERISEGRFREDLYYRLNVLDLTIPPLRERPSDLPLLLEYFLVKFTPPGQEPPAVSPRAWKLLQHHGWPGNIREFAHAVERAVVLSRGREIDLDHLPADLAGASPPPGANEPDFRPLAVAAKQFERAHLLQALTLAGGRRGRAAELLGISRKNLWEKLRAHGVVDPGDADD